MQYGGSVLTGDCIVHLDKQHGRLTIRKCLNDNDDIYSLTNSHVRAIKVSTVGLDALYMR